MINLNNNYNENDYILDLKKECNEFNYNGELDLPLSICMQYTYSEDLYSNDEYERVVRFNDTYSNLYKDKWYINNIKYAIENIKDKIDNMCSEITKKANGKFVLKYEPEYNDFDTDYFSVAFYAESTEPITEPTFLDLNPIIRLLIDMDIEELDNDWEEDWSDYYGSSDEYIISARGSITSIVPDKLYLG